jgi:hypothetical protein
MVKERKCRDIKITSWTPGNLGQVAALHGRYYARE